MDKYNKNLRRSSSLKKKVARTCLSNLNWPHRMVKITVG